jgi:hypothetical protein
MGQETTNQPRQTPSGHRRKQQENEDDEYEHYYEYAVV